MPGTDPQFGLALDIFVVHSTVNGNAAGQAAVRRGIQGGIFRGNGDAHAVVLSLFDATGAPQSPAITRYVGAHEIGHFLSLLHTTDPTLAFDPILDTPHAARSAYDLNGNNVYDPAEITNSANHPDFSNLLYPYLPPTGNVTAGTVSAAQGRAMRAYLAIREH